jgi:hypothetical protein
MWAQANRQITTLNRQAAGMTAPCHFISLFWIPGLDSHLLYRNNNRRDVAIGTAKDLTGLACLPPAL